MADVEPAPRRSGGPPRWMMFTGCGCLLPGFILVATVAWTMQLFGQLIHTAEAWRGLEALIAFDDSARGVPTGEEDNPNTPVDESREQGEFKLLLGGAIPFSGGVEAYWFGRSVPSPADTDRSYGEDALSVTFLKLPSDQSEAATTAAPGTPTHEDMTVEVQGVPLRGRRLPEMVSDELYFKISGLEEVRGAGAAVWLREGFTDPEEEGETFDLLLFLQRPASSQPITDAEIVRFLEPFHVAALAEEASADGGEGAGEGPGGDGEGR
ncbi:MAG: hypothetical protein PVJ89_01945 [Planctomycetota bacterium]